MGKRNVLAFIVLVFLLKPVIHFTLFPEQEEYINYDKKIILAPKENEMTLSEIDEFHIWSQWQSIPAPSLHLGSKGEKLEREAVSGVGYNYFYYPKENRILSFRSHLQLLLKEKLWIFAISFGCVLLLVFFLGDKIKYKPYNNSYFKGVWKRFKKPFSSVKRNEIVFFWTHRRYEINKIPYIIFLTYSYHNIYNTSSRSK